MQAIIDAALDRRRSAILAFLMLVLSGIYAYSSIPKESNPDINIPIIYVSMHLDGISPSDSEKLLIKPMEQQLMTLSSVKEITSSGYLGGGNIVLEFEAGFDVDNALDKVREAVDKGKAELPADADEPKIEEVNFSLFPVLVVTLSGDLPDRLLLQASKRLQDKIENINTVLEANLAGDREEQIEIVIDPSLIQSYGLKGTEIVSYFQRSDKLVAAGSLDTGKGNFDIKVPGLFSSVRDILTMPLVAEGDSAILTEDIAKVYRNFKDRSSFARINGENAIAIEVVKRTGENIIDTIASVKEVVEAEKKFLPETLKIQYSQDQSEDIKVKLSDLQNNILSAILLVVILVVLALGIVSGLLVGIAIPGAFLTGVLVLYMLGYTVNTVVLFALILSVGMLVDGAIVVVELADRKMSEGLDKIEAYGEAAKRMSWPIIASTATTLAAFAPLLFWPGVVGEFMKFMPVTLIAVLGSSLIMALIFIPVIGSIIGRKVNPKDKKNNNLRASEDGDLSKITGATGLYVRVLNAALKIPGFVIIAAFAMLISVQVYYKNHGNGVSFFPSIEPNIANILIHARGNLSIHEQDKLVREVEEKILDLEGMKTIYTRTGKSGNNNEIAEDVIGVIQLEFKNWQLRDTATEIIKKVEDRTKDISGIRIEVQKQEDGPPTGKALQLQLSSREPDTLIPAVKKILQGLEEVGDFKDIEDTRSLPGIEWELQIDRAQAAKFGLDTTSIGQSVQLVTNGLRMSEYRPSDSDEEIDVILRYSKGERTLDQLDRLEIETEQGSVPMSNFVKRVAKPKVSKINRADGYRIMTIKAELPDGMNVDAKIKEMEEWLSNSDWDPRVEFTFKGEDEDQKESQQFLMKAFVVALFIMAIILITQFNSFYHALLILSAVIMSTIGVMLGLLIMDKPFGIIMSGIGVISLAGIIVNNNIVLIDTYNHIKKKHKNMAIREVILRTGAQRLRPVFLTTITTVLGLLPMVLQMNIDFITREISVGAPSTQWWVDLSTAVAFGLIFSTPLTLIVTPAALMFEEKVSTNYKKVKNYAQTKILSRTSGIKAKI